MTADDRSEICGSGVRMHRRKRWFEYVDVVRICFRPAILLKCLSLIGRGYLHESGWVKSLETRLPVDGVGRPVPWMTLPFNDFIEKRLSATMAVFEYGCGNSTLFFAERVARVDSVEHDIEWVGRLRDKLPGNVHLSFVALEYGGAYAQAVCASGVKYDLVIVDGRDRVRSVVSCFPALSLRGCVVLDDSERLEYEGAVGALRNAGFKRLDFWGLAPGLTYRKCTSVFYRSNNCLGI